jgi:hypothetical protein
MDAQRTAAIRRAFAGVEKEWLAYYLANLLSGDRRFVVVDGKVGPRDLTVKVRNTGQPARRRIEGRVDATVLEPPGARVSLPTTVASEPAAGAAN